MTLATPVNETAPAWRVWAGFFGAVAPISAGVGLVPLMTSAAMASRHINEAAVGAAFSADFFCNAMTTIWLSRRLAFLSPRLLGAAGALLVLLGNASAMFGDSFIGLVLAFAARGAGIGCLANVQSALAARMASPQRMLGASMPVQILFTVASPLIAGRLMASTGQVGVFGIYAASGLIALPMLLMAPGAPAFPGPSVKRDIPAEIIDLLRSTWSLLRSPFVWAGIFAFLALNALWPFFAEIAGKRGFSTVQTGDLIAVVTIGAGTLGIASAFIPDGLVRRALLAAILACGTGAALVPLAPSHALLIAAFALMASTFVFLQNLFIVVGVRLDRTGSLNAGSGGVNALVSAAVPAAAGALAVATGGYAILAPVAIAGALIGFALLMRASHAMQ